MATLGEKRKVAFRPDEQVVLPERRISERFQTTYRPCCVVADGRIMLGLIRNFSLGGAQIEVDAELEVGAQITYFCELQARVPGKIAWRKGRSHGIQHLEGRAPIQENFPARSVRVPCQVRADCWVNGVCHSVRLENISLGGVRVRGLPDFMPGTLASVEFCGLQFELVTIRWSKDETAGLRFSQRLSRETLARLLMDERFGLSSIEFGAEDEGARQ